MRMFLSCMAAAAVLASAASAHAEDLLSPYVGLKAGASFAQADDVSFHNPRLKSSIGDDYNDTNAMLAASVGAGLRGTPFRAELEYAWRDGANFTRDDNIGAGAGQPARQTPRVQSQSVMAYGFYDIDTGTRFTPFLSGGLGVSINKAKAYQTQPSSDWNEAFTGKTRTEFAWGVGAGVAVSVMPSLSLDVGYRYVDLGKWSVGEMRATGDEDLTGSLRSHEVYAGLRYAF